MKSKIKLITTHINTSR